MSCDENRPDDLADLLAGLKGLRSGMARVEAPARVEARLLAAFRARTGSAAQRTRPAWLRVASWGAVAAMAATALVLVSERPPVNAPAARRIELADPAYADGFLPLPGVAQASGSDELSVLHVELPRAAMMQVGIEVSPERASERVKADVMVGGDGLARAVRFEGVSGSD
jgi:hypothetical protein